jgi:hypothetical protein
MDGRRGALPPGPSLCPVVAEAPGAQSRPAWNVLRSLSSWMILEAKCTKSSQRYKVHKGKECGASGSVLGESALPVIHMLDTQEEPSWPGIGAHRDLPVGPAGPLSAFLVSQISN